MKNLPPFPLFAVLPIVSIVAVFAFGEEEPARSDAAPPTPFSALFDEASAADFAFPREEAVASSNAEKEGGVAVSVEVVPAASRVPAGEDFSLLVKMAMPPRWHLYWRNPGEAGMPLDIAWENVPAGVSFGEWRWSAPKFYSLQGIASYVFEKEAWVEIPVRVAAEVPAGTLALGGRASWLACDDSGCYPQEKAFSVSVEIAPAGAERVPANADFARAAEASFPRSDASVSATVFSSPTAQTAELRVRFPAGKFPGGARDLRFFPQSEKFAASAAQAVPVERAAGAEGGVGEVVFSLELTPGETLFSAEEAAGVLVGGDGAAYELHPARGAGGEPVSAGTAAEATERLSSAENAPAFAVSASFFGLLALAFAGGLILNLMPCVFPVLGLKIMHFVGQAGTEKKKIVRHGLAFGAGVLISFWVLAGVLIVLRSGGERLGWGFQLQEPAFVYAMVLLLLVFGLSMSGVFEFGVGATRAGGLAKGKTGVAGAFLSGALAVIVATPCAAPFLAPALGSALTLPPFPSILLFTAIALGLAAPYVLLSCFPKLLKFLPKPGAWMETFKQAMAFLLYAPALYFVWVLMGQVDDAGTQRDLLLSLVFVALACWIYGHWAVAWRGRVSRVTGTLVALAIFAGTVFYAGTLLVSQNEEKSGETSAKAEAWIPWTPQAQAQAIDAGKIVYVDFTARWCATCQANKRVYSDEILQEKFAAAGVVKMRADWTNKNAEIAAELEKYGRAAVPVNVFLKKGKKPVLLGELFSGAGTVLGGLEEMLSADSDATVPAQ